MINSGFIGSSYVAHAAQRNMNGIFPSNPLAHLGENPKKAESRKCDLIQKR
jgi:hypothetical protein